MMDANRRATDLAHGHTAQSRANRLRAEQVEVGLVMQEMLGTRAAAGYFCENHISINVATRVLTRPSQRRWRAPVNVASFEAAPVI
ncbi:hypothetical protein GJV26_18610 [Massilia dura]|uniref:ANTAR domain-containing protein n=1 Tax=Pseudoduganella dura TaxID=321982 RepID=A0A6I3XBZ8_9BURK|nr:hypothetical protein [Pseudoduganella dura]MUI14454.1 hypothetical protein [Pseudoduganella dura]GGY07991.1 hypothetical protein GCM10007386_43080 [Pseudoduganella dura]